MKKLLLSAAVYTLVSSGAMAANIGVSIRSFDDNFLTVMRAAMQDYARTQPDMSLKIEDAQNDADKQLNEIRDFIAQKVDAIIVNAVDSARTPQMTELAAAAGVPLVYVNNLPSDPKLPAKVVFVGGDERVAGTLEAREVCKLMGGKGDIVILMGVLSTYAARQRAVDVEQVVKTPECAGMKIRDRETANYSRAQAATAVTNWIKDGLKFDAIIAGNDTMAIGAIQALKAAGKVPGVGPGKIVVSGIDATQEGLAAMKSGDLAVTVFQDAVGRGRAAVETALKLIKGEKVDQMVWQPLELVTPANMDKFSGRN
jgi:inositol transport system substrate-binding protein